MCPDTNSPEDSGKSYNGKKNHFPHFTDKNRGPGAPTPHECPLNRNCRAKCLAWQGSGKPGESKNGLPEALRWFRRNHKWHDSGPLGNQVKLRLVFKKPIRSAVNTMLIDRLDGLTAKIEGVFSKLQKKAEALDDLCVNRINDEDKLVMLEHTMAYLDEGLGELADLIEIGVQNRECRIKNEETTAKTPENSNQWLTNSEAGEILGIHRSTVSKWANKGRFSDNGIKGQKKRLSKASVLLVKQDIDDEYLKNDDEDVCDDRRRYK
jgi:hypothetical protein